MNKLNYKQKKYNNLNPVISDKNKLLYNLSKKKQIVRNQIPVVKNSSGIVWEYTYFKHILELKKIFDTGIKKNKKNIDTQSIEFLSNFCIFLKAGSSGEISPYIENLDTYTENLFLIFTIKRNEL